MFKLPPLNGDEEIKDNEKCIASISDFWGWTFSALYVPITRGFFAEYIVFESINDGSDNEFRPPLNYLSTKLEKDEPDLITYHHDDKMTIQVKSIDSLTAPSAFNIKKTHKYNQETDKNDGEKNHCSDLFVFCYFNLDAKKHRRIDSLRKNGNKISKEEENEYSILQERLNGSVRNMENWTFYLCPSKVVEHQETITISRLKEHIGDNKVKKCCYSDLCASLKTYHKMKIAGLDKF